MPDEAPKSAYELAMERLRRKDAEQGVEERAVTRGAEERDRRDPARLLGQGRRGRDPLQVDLDDEPDPEARMKLEAEHRRDLQRLHDDRERKLAKVRG